MLDLGLDGKVALVTGANHGIGAAIATLLAEQGARVFIAYYRPDTELPNEELEATRREAAGGPVLYHAMQQQPAEVTVEKIRAAGGTAIAEHADLESAAAAVELVGRCEEAFGSVDILINNHAHCRLETFDPAMGPQLGMEVELTDATGMDRHFAINARASALMRR